MAAEFTPEDDAAIDAYYATLGSYPPGSGPPDPAPDAEADGPAEVWSEIRLSGPGNEAEAG
jgi:hypothetical protein